MKSVREIAEMFGVTITAVRYWLSRGLPYKLVSYVGFKRRKMIDPQDVVEYLHMSGEEAKKYLRGGKEGV